MPAAGGTTLLHEFAAGDDDGEDPYGSLTLSGSTLYGLAGCGGLDDKGAVFSVPIPEPASMTLLAFGAVTLLRRRLRQM